MYVTRLIIGNYSSKYLKIENIMFIVPNSTNLLSLTYELQNSYSTNFDRKGSHRRKAIGKSIAFSLLFQIKTKTVFFNLDYLPNTYIHGLIMLNNIKYCTVL